MLTYKQKQKQIQLLNIFSKLTKYMKFLGKKKKTCQEIYLFSFSANQFCPWTSGDGPQPFLGYLIRHCITFFS